MKFCVIGSGSSGNMTYVETAKAKVLVDVGISLTDAIKRTSGKGIDLTTIDAIFITHEHKDHIKHIERYAKRTKAIIYINKDSFETLDSDTKESLVGKQIKFIESDTRYVHNDLEIFTLQLKHDSLNCFGFVFLSAGKVLTYITDTGYIPERYLSLLRISTGIIIESNHDIQMQQNSGRPGYLIRRILSRNGHLSNKTCKEILANTITNVQKVIVLAHISEDCNNDEIITTEVIDCLKEKSTISFFIARQREALDLIDL